MKKLSIRTPAYNRRTIIVNSEHLRTYSRRILLKVTAKEGFKPKVNSFWACLFGIFIHVPSFLTGLLSQHILYVFKLNDEILKKV